MTQSGESVRKGRGFLSARTESTEQLQRREGARRFPYRIIYPPFKKARLLTETFILSQNGGPRAAGSESQVGRTGWKIWRYGSCHEIGKLENRNALIIDWHMIESNALYARIMFRLFFIGNHWRVTDACVPEHAADFSNNYPWMSHCWYMINTNYFKSRFFSYNV